MQIERIHHVAYRCKDAQARVRWYQRMLKMDFVLAIAEDQVPSTKAPDPYMHVFLDAGGGNVLAFFDLPTQPPLETPTTVMARAGTPTPSRLSTCAATWVAKESALVFGGRWSLRTTKPAWRRVSRIASYS